MIKRIEKLREQHRRMVNDITRTQAQREAAIMTIVKTVEKLRKLALEERRISKRLEKAQSEKPGSLGVKIFKEMAASFDPAADCIAVKENREILDEGIPEFLKRPRESSEDAKVAAQLKAEQEERKSAKARGRIAKLKAKKSGETQKMPLSGKAALKHIRGE